MYVRLKYICKKIKCFLMWLILRKRNSIFRKFRCIFPHQIYMKFFNKFDTHENHRFSFMEKKTSHLCFHHLYRRCHTPPYPGVMKVIC